MVLKLYGSPLSPPTRLVQLVLKEKNVPYEYYHVDFIKGETRSPEYVEKQPFGQVPLIDDDGFLLFESRAIARYIAAKYAAQGTPLLPSDLKAVARFDQAASIEQNNFDPYVVRIVTERVYKPMQGLKTDEQNVAKDLETLDAKLAVYDKILGKQRYLAGDELTLADLFHIPYGSMLAVAHVNILETKPNVDRWWKEITSRAAWDAVKDGVTS